MLLMSRKSLLIISLLTLAWVFSACKGTTDQVSVRLDSYLPPVDFAVDYKPVLETNALVPESQFSAQSGCFEGGCHANLKAAQEQFIHPMFAQNQCLACHTADHTDSEFTPERTMELCVSCHSAESLGNSHVVGPGITDPRNGEMLTCLSCHGQHSGQYNAVLLMNGSGALCVSCHTDFLNASAQP